MVAVRKTIDRVGRIVIPYDIRMAMGFEEGDELSIEIHHDKLVLRKVGEPCKECGRP